MRQGGWRLLLAAAAVGCVLAQGYEIPEVKIQVHRPRGFTASIPDKPGIGLFSFNGNINSDIRSPDVGDFSGEVVRAAGGRWAFSSRDAELAEGDTLHYWVMVSHNRLGYIKDDLKFVFDGKVSAPPPDAPPAGPAAPAAPACAPSATTVRGAPACSGQLIFEDDFASPSDKWQFEQHIPTHHPDYPFVSYQNLESVIKVEDGTLRIAPTLLQTLPPHSVESIRTGTLDLYPGCTESADACTMTAAGADILPPVVSGRANTKLGFAFKYGTVTVRARLVRGDWLYPELLLEPLASRYGRDGFSSGTIIVGGCRGNRELRSGAARVGNTRLLGGVVLDRFLCHDRLLLARDAAPWSDHYHNYTVRWAPDGFTWYVDGAEYGSLPAPAGGWGERLRDCPGVESVRQRWARGSNIAPFDQEFYLSLGVLAGGITSFPDDSVSLLGRNKPWRDRSSKAKLHFWQDLERWYPTWDDRSTLRVDSIRVTAL